MPGTKTPAPGPPAPTSADPRRFQAFHHHRGCEPGGFAERGSLDIREFVSRITGRLCPPTRSRLTTPFRELLTRITAFVVLLPGANPVRDRGPSPQSHRRQRCAGAAFDRYQPGWARTPQPGTTAQRQRSIPRRPTSGWLRPCRNKPFSGRARGFRRQNAGSFRKSFHPGKTGSGIRFFLHFPHDLAFPIVGEHAATSRNGDSHT